MPDVLVTNLQIFWIGFSLAAYGPCLISCTPVIVTYVTGRQRGWVETLADITLFLSGRLLAYVVLGAVAGLSGFYLKRFVEANLVPYFNITSGIISILLGAVVLLGRNAPSCACNKHDGKAYGLGGVLVLGFMIGISPCGPLTALLFEIALISRSALEGATYALSFGLGTFLAGLIVIGALAGILKGPVRRFFASGAANNIFRISCAAILALLGAGFILAGIRAL